MSAIDRDLTPELLDLMEHEKIIEQGLAGFIEVGWALLAIKADKKYRHVGYKTFEEYCDKRWSIGSSHRVRLMVAASVAETLVKNAPKGELLLPERETQVRPLTRLKDDGDKVAAWSEAVEEAGGQPTQAQVEKAVAKRRPPDRDHPAPFSDPILAVIAEHLPSDGTVVDPFAGTGRVHELATDDRKTIGVEIEPEWAAKHPDTVEGNALELTAMFEAGSIDAIVTSPSYGNRMADHHDAKDDSVRLTYKHTLGRDLHVDNSGAMQWGEDYRELHRKVWRECFRVLRRGGTFTLNIKNHVRDGEIQRVAEWHIDELIRAKGMELVRLDIVATRGLMAGENAETRTPFEYVVTFRKPS